jgi:hypothetical protein
LDAALRNKKRQDTNRYLISFTKDDYVLLYEPRSVWARLHNTEDVIKGKLKMRFSGPHNIVKQGANDNVYHIFHIGRNKEEVVNVNRLVKYVASSNDQATREAHREREQLLVHNSFRGIPTVGDLVAVNLNSPGEPFAIGRVLRRTMKGKLTVHWYGNYHNIVGGAYRPGWVDTSKNKHYYRPSREPNSRHPKYTNITSRTTITDEHILLKGFTLEGDKVPAWVLDYIDADSGCEYARSR